MRLVVGLGALVCLLGEGPGPEAAAGFSTPAPQVAFPSRIKVTANDPAPGDQFACALAVSPPWLLVGSLLDDDRGSDSGSAYFFQFRDGEWIQEDKVVGEDTGAGDEFGFATALAGDRGVVGAPFHRGSGAAYVFAREGLLWRQEAKLTPSDGRPGDEFGTAVALVGDHLAVGAPRRDGRGPDSGAVYVFVRTREGWQEEARLEADDGAAADFFGRSVALVGDLLAVGAPFDDDAGSNSGSVYLFRRQETGWVQEAKLRAPDARPFDAFGFAVTTDGERVLVGAPLADRPGSSAGAAYIFRRGQEGWEAEAVLRPRELAAGDQFGISVALEGGTALAGARFRAVNDLRDAGATWVFRHTGDGWEEAGLLVAPDAGRGDEFGIATSLRMGVAAVGAYRHDEGGTDAGAAYVFAPEADLAIAKERFQVAVVPGRQVAYGIEVGNRGPSDVLGARVEDPLPPALAGAAWTCSGEGGGRCTVSGQGSIDDRVDLPAGSRVVYQLSARVRPDARGELVNTATVEPPGGVADPTPEDQTAVDRAVLVPVADLTTSLARVEVAPVPTALEAAPENQDEEDGVVPGLSVGYRIEVANAGPSDAPGVQVINRLPPILLGATWICTPEGGAGCTPEGQGDIDDLADLPTRSRVVYLLTARVDPGALGTLTNSVEVLLPEDVRDPTPENNLATDSVRLTPRAELALSKESDQPVLVPGGPVDYTIELGSQGPSHLASVRVLDNLPPDVTGGVWTCVPSGGATCTPAGIGDIDDTLFLPAGGQVTYRLGAMVVPSPRGAIVNRVCVFAPEGAFLAVRSRLASLIAVAGGQDAPGISGTLTVSGDFREEGTVFYQARLTNNLPRTQYDNPGDEFSIVLPPELSLVGATSEEPQVATNLGTNTVTWNGILCPADSVTIDIEARINPGTAGQVISAQGEIRFDVEGDGVNESMARTSDPEAETPESPTTFQVADGG